MIFIVTQSRSLPQLSFIHRHVLISHFILLLLCWISGAHPALILFPSTTRFSSLNNGGEDDRVQFIFVDGQTKAPLENAPYRLMTPQHTNTNENVYQRDKAYGVATEAISMEEAKPENDLSERIRYLFVFES